MRQELQQHSDDKNNSIAGGSPIEHPKNDAASDGAVSKQLSYWLSLVAKNKDKQAFTELFSFFAPKIKYFGLKQYQNQAQAKELVQETMTSVWRKAHLYDASKGAATTWIYTIMRNASFDYLRKLKSKNEQQLGDDIWPIEQAIDEQVSTSSVFSDHLMTKQLEQYVDSLPNAQRAVVKGVYYQELSQEQLSKQLGVPIGTIKSRLRLALEKIRQQMGEQEND